MEDDYWSIDAIFAENQVPERVLCLLYLHSDTYLTQKLDCTFLLDVPNLGYIDAGDEPNVRIPYSPCGPGGLDYAHLRKIQLFRYQHKRKCACHIGSQNRC